ncbi:isomerase [Arthrobacter crystallopoietes BAB-32]|uniref:Isomerase n=1 Tax=Arthrobacter crystallopoietes BAB-32 TaxID=1246476 RepID=N1V377_9MICC|nr:histidine phosphatase family protein [Arthrobacter crystallopoietes]EMY35775.1 isomerase [Arthrobacter crystallopoietes BAB-32]
MRLLLIRHGQTPSNIKGLLDTDIPGPELTSLGHDQARALPQALAGEPIERLYASTAIRTQLTASPLAEATRLEVGVRDGLREISAGAYEMLGDVDSVRAYLETVFAWTAGELDGRMPGGPDGHETFGRFDDVVAEAEAEGLGTVALFSHGAMIRSWAGARAENLDAGFVASNVLSNTGVVVLEGSGGNWEARTWMGEAVGGRALADPLTDGPAGDAVPGPGSPGI